MISLQSAIRFSPKMDVISGAPLVACVTEGHFWVYLPQTLGSKRTNIISRKGTLQDLYDLIPKDTPVYDVQGISVKVFLEYRPKEYDKEARHTLNDFIQALKDNGAKEL